MNTNTNEWRGNMSSMPIKAALTNLGLTKNEATVYLTALESGPTTVINLSKVTGLPRGSIYNVINSLLEQGLFFQQARGNRQVYGAEAPESFEKVLEKKKKLLHRIIPSLHAISGAEQEAASEEKTASPLAIAFADLNKQLKKTDELFAVIDPHQIKKLDQEVLATLQQRKNSKMVLMGIDENPEFDHMLKDQTIAFSPKIAVNSIIIGPRQVIFIHQDNEQVITNDEQVIVDTCHQIFSGLWLGLDSARVEISPMTMMPQGLEA